MKNLISCRINVMISNMDQGISFYRDTLGLTVINRYGDHYAELQTPDMWIALHLNTEKVTVGNNMSIGFGVSDFDTVVKELQMKGVAINVEKDGWIRLAHFTDMDQNQLFLAERADE